LRQQKEQQETTSTFESKQNLKTSVVVVVFPTPYCRSFCLDHGCLYASSRKRFGTGLGALGWMQQQPTKYPYHLSPNFYIYNKVLKTSGQAGQADCPTVCFDGVLYNEDKNISSKF